MAQEVGLNDHRSDSRWFDPRLRLHVQATLGNILNPKLLPVAVPSVCEATCEWLSTEISVSPDRRRDEQVGTLHGTPMYRMWIC